MRHGYQLVTVGYLAVLWIGSRLSSRYCFPLSFVWYGRRIIGNLPIKYAFMIRQVLIPKYKESFSEMGKRYYL